MVKSGKEQSCMEKLEKKHSWTPDAQSYLVDQTISYDLSELHQINTMSIARATRICRVI